MRAGIVGASGYTGGELLRLCALHPELEVEVAGADSHAGQTVAEVCPSLAAAYPSLVFTKVAPDDVRCLDVVFLALPHGESSRLVPAFLDSTKVLVDLSADFRLRDSSAYPKWYGTEHPCVELLGRFVFGLPELFREDLHG
ncbi:MAG: N-acetyl-gamma-glutamyl-phosphate reductase, partial [Nitrososphaerales archaeon]